MANTTLIVFLVADFLFLVSGALLLAASLIFKSGPGSGPIDDAASSLLLQLTPLAGGVVNAVFVFITFAVSIPGVLMRENRAWLRVHSYLLIVCSLITLVLGLDIWFSTLKTRSNLDTAWGQLSSSDQSELQQQFQCCGYLNPINPPFVTDSTCTNTDVANQLGGCVTPFSNFANQFLDIVFTAMFGGVALDIITFFAAIVVLKDRDEQKRYRLIDEKYGFGAL